MRQANIGLPPAWDMIARRGLGRRGQVLNWIGAKRYEALRRKGRWRKAGQSSEAQAAFYRVLLHCATVRKFPGGKLPFGCLEWAYGACLSGLLGESAQGTCKQGRLKSA